LSECAGGYDDGSCKGRRDEDTTKNRHERTPPERTTDTITHGRVKPS
jgi:hypothetical protein